MSTQAPDDQPGYYYVSVRDEARRTVLALGPFENAHATALRAVDTVRRYASDHDPRGCWYSYGTCRLPIEVKAPDGKLNALVLPIFDQALAEGRE